MSDAVDGFVSLLVMVGVFCAGKKIGEKRTEIRYDNQKRDDEIFRLKQEIERLKNSSKTLS